MKLFFDTETTGKANFRALPTDLNQPRIVQFGALLTDDSGNEWGVIDLVVKPDGWTVPAEVSAIHGITTDKATAAGVPIVTVLDCFDNFLQLVDEVIAHNDDFDHLVTRCEYRRVSREMMPMKRFCTMKASTKICKLPGRYGDFKWPSLAEAYRIICGKEIEDAHDAMADVRACKEVYFELKKQAAPTIPPTELL